VKQENLTNLSLSVVLPVFNGGAWIKETVLNVIASLRNSPWELTELICVNDGSTDNTSLVLGELANNFHNLNFVVINQENRGRYLARASGIKAGSGNYVLLIDSRVHINSNSLNAASELVQKFDALTSHVEYASTNKIYGWFWSAAEVIFWNKYWKNPRNLKLNEENFDLIPKGTTCFLSERKLLQKSMNSFNPAVTNIKNSSDDTELIRNMINFGNVGISPLFTATYHARVSFHETIKHTYYRGVMFADGHVLRNSKLWQKLIGFLSIITGTVVIYFLQFFTVLNFFLLFSISNLLLILKFPLLRWKRLISLNIFVIPMFLTWIVGVTKGVSEKK